MRRRTRRGAPVVLLVLAGWLLGCAPDEPGRGAVGSAPGARASVVVRVVDGDTVVLRTGHVVRLVGIDAPERGQCGFGRATRRLGQLVLGRRVRLVRPVADRDRYGRLLRYVDAAGKDAGLVLVREGLAVARYDSRDGYGFHPREPAYVAADGRDPSTDGGDCAGVAAGSVRCRPPKLTCP